MTVYLPDAKQLSRLLFAGVVLETLLRPDCMDKPYTNALFQWVDSQPETRHSSNQWTE
jgi:hypothetical protein